MTGDKTIWVAVVLSLATFTSGCLSVKQPLAEDEGSGGSPVTAGSGVTGGVTGDPATAGASGVGGYPVDPDDPAYMGDPATAGASGVGGYPVDPDDPAYMGDPATAGASGVGGYPVDPNDPATAGAAWPGGDMGTGGMPTTPGTGGWTGGDMGAGGIPCDCLPPTDPCMTTRCDASGQCVYESFASMVDDDGDGVSDACDCDDSNPDVYPGQTGYFSTPNGRIDPTLDPAMGGDMGAGGSVNAMNPDGSGGVMGNFELGFDYDCNYWAEPRLDRIAGDCDVLPGADACVGDGWVPDASGAIPACGQLGRYRACRYADGACVPNEIELQQMCR